MTFATLERQWFEQDKKTITLWNAGVSIESVARLTDRSENGVIRTLTAYGHGGRNPRTGEKVFGYVRGYYEPEEGQ